MYESVNVYNEWHVQIIKPNEMTARQMNKWTKYVNKREREDREGGGEREERERERDRDS